MTATKIKTYYIIGRFEGRVALIRSRAQDLSAEVTEYMVTYLRI